ncbi:MAG: transposase [Bacteroidia bacterium]|jgi:transposase-like protein|nr:transposase [Bacteroidia bacterium]
MSRKVNKLSDDLQLQVVKEYLYHGATHTELKIKYNFTGCNNIYNWMRKFGLSKPSETDKKLHQFMAKEVQKTTAEEKLELKIKKLEDELKREQFKTLALNTMINIAERELKVDIRKKPGAKR